MAGRQEDGEEEPEAQEQEAEAASNGAAVDFTERAKYIPLRLSHEERRLLRLLEAALSVSEYTDKVRRLALPPRGGQAVHGMGGMNVLACGGRNAELGMAGTGCACKSKGGREFVAGTWCTSCSAVEARPGCFHDCLKLLSGRKQTQRNG